MRNIAIGKTALLAVFIITLVLGSVVRLAKASSSSHRDDAYYPAGTSNPLVSNSMYWRDGKNILEDLDHFESLSVKYERCV
jgi:hypothetical protein